MLIYRQGRFDWSMSMYSLAARKNRFNWLVVVSLVLITTPLPAQFTDPKPSALRQSLVEMLNNGKVDEALGLLKTRSTDPKPAMEVAEAMFMVAKFLFVREEYAGSLDLLKRIADKFPDTPPASLAWCGMGQVYGKLGDNAKMIAALERGMAAPRAWTEMNIMDAGDTHGYACETLGHHYMKNREWGKALSVYTRWKPSSWCGTCVEGMQLARGDRIRLCQAHLGQFSAVIDQAWRESTGDQLKQRKK